MNVFLVSHSDAEGDMSTVHVAQSKDKAIAWIHNRVKVESVHGDVYYYEEEPSYYRTYYSIREWEVED